MAESCWTPSNPRVGTWDTPRGQQSAWQEKTIECNSSVACVAIACDAVACAGNGTPVSLPSRMTLFLVAQASVPTFGECGLTWDEKGAQEPCQPALDKGFDWWGFDNGFR